HLSAGRGGIGATGSVTSPSIAATGQVSLDTTGGIGASNHPVLFDAVATPAAGAVGTTTPPGGGAYISALGALSLGNSHTATALPEVTASAGLTLAPDALIDTGTGTISLAAGVNPDGMGSSTGGKLVIAGGATVVSDNAGSTAITLRGSDIDISA